MAKQTRTTLKGYFETGDIPNQSQYGHLIDSKVNLSENNTGDIQLTGNMTASGNISASGNLYTNQLQVDNFIHWGSPVGDNGIIYDDGTNLQLGYNDTDVISAKMSQVTIAGNTRIIGHITASGNISSSYTSTGSFGSAMLTNLSTTEPLVSGALWLSGSGGGSATGSKYLMVFTG